MRLQQALMDRTFTARVMLSTGFVTPMRPDKALSCVRALREFGPTTAASVAVGAVRHPDQPMVIDERGMLTFAEVHRRSNAIAHALSDRGLLEGDRVAVMCRNHRYFVELTAACSKLGVHVLYLNTAFAGPQLTDVVKREKPVALIYDAEFADLIAEAGTRRKRFVAWFDESDGKLKDPTVDDLISEGDPADVVAPAEPGRVVILTSGTTGTPKGARRKQPDSLRPAAILLDVIPLKAGERTMIAAPMFHSWGLLHFALGVTLGSTFVLRRHFDPEATLRAVSDERCTALAVVPVMLQRMLEVEPEAVADMDFGALRIIAASGSALPGELATRVMDRFGDVLYNLYGSTEVGWATIASPADMRLAPGTAGRVPFGTVVRLYDEQEREVGPGETGRIFVGNEMSFDGYTGGGTKASIGDLLSSGDVGHFDSDGLLFVDGRDDEMIVSGGENVFPREVEDVVADMEGVDDVAMVGVPDEQFGQRLVGFVVLSPGAELTEDAIQTQVRASLARFKIPRDITFIDELPRNATGKILKRELRERYDEARSAPAAD